jgi:protocatechuate 3,4-dioxygenase beta subunit
LDAIFIYDKGRKMSHIFLALILSGFISAGNAQQPAKTKTSQTQPRPGNPGRAKTDRAQMLSGRVVDEAGKPMFETTVIAVAAGQPGRESKLGALNTRAATTNEDGNFAFEGLSSGAYRLSVIAQGYTMAPESLKENGGAKYYRPGDHVNIRLVKGGVITGTVMTQSGEPLVGVRVRVLKVKDAQGRVDRGFAVDETSLMKEWKTDDRGVYRIYGLEPGKYLVSAGGKGFNPMSMGEFDSDAPTYYPTGTRDMAAEVGVQAGQESASIDIRYRDNKGHIISGNLTASEATNSQVNIALLMLANASTGGLESWTMSGIFGENLTEGKRPFALTSVPDGEYTLSATSASTSVLGGVSGVYVAPPRRVKVKGSDVTGLELTLFPLGSISGQFVIDKAKTQDGKPVCPNSRNIALEEVVIIGRSEAKNKEASALKMPASLSAFSVTPEGAPDEKGAFKISTMDSSRYRLEIKLPSEDLYIRAITSPKTAAASQAKDTVAAQAKATPTGETATVNAAKEEIAKQMKDVARNGIPLKLGEKIDNILITAAEGAAGLQGQIKVEKEGDTLPARLRIFLLPAEAENLDNVLRFFETDMQKEGAFSIRNIPPGRYYIMARAVNEEANEENPHPVAWDGDLRKLLHTEAEAKNLLLELQPCQRVTDYVLRYATPASLKKTEQKKSQQ